MRRFLAPSLAAGVVSALLYIVVFTFGMGFLFLFLPTLPVFWLGLSRRSDDALHAALIATVILSVVSNPVSAVAIYLLCLGFPAWYIAHECMKAGKTDRLVFWFPLTVIFARLMAAFSFGLLFLALYYSQRAGGLPDMLTPHINEALSHLSAEVDNQASTALAAAAPGLLFLVFAVIAWMWSACLYLHAWVVSRELRRQKIPTRPSLAIEPFPPPNWTISLLLIAAIASLVGSPSLALWGKASLIMMLFPHFLFGMALLHAQTRKSAHRGLLLFFTYLLLSVLLWPVLLVAAYGFFYHIKLLNKYLSGGGTSFRS